MSASGEVAVVGNAGTGSGDADTVSIIDLKVSPARVVDTLTVGQTPEGVRISPDGKYVAFIVANGSNKPKSSPFFNDNGLVKIFAINGTKLTAVTEAKTGHWCQGAVWNKTATTLMVQCMVEPELQVFGFNGKTLTPRNPIKLKAGRPVFAQPSGDPLAGTLDVCVSAPRARDHPTSPCAVRRAFLGSAAPSAPWMPVSPNPVIHGGDAG